MAGQRPFYLQPQAWARNMAFNPVTGITDFSNAIRVSYASQRTYYTESVTKMTEALISARTNFGSTKTDYDRALATGDWELLRDANRAKDSFLDKYHLELEAHLYRRQNEAQLLAVTTSSQVMHLGEEIEDLGSYASYVGSSHEALQNREDLHLLKTNDLETLADRADARITALDTQLRCVQRVLQREEQKNKILEGNLARERQRTNLVEEKIDLLVGHLTDVDDDNRALRNKLEVLEARVTETEAASKVRLLNNQPRTFIALNGVQSERKWDALAQIWVPAGTNPAQTQIHVSKEDLEGEEVLEKEGDVDEQAGVVDEYVEDQHEVDEAQGVDGAAEEDQSSGSDSAEENDSDGDKPASEAAAALEVHTEDEVSSPEDPNPHALFQSAVEHFGAIINEYVAALGDSEAASHEG